MIFDHSECIISLFNPHNARFVVENFGFKLLDIPTKEGHTFSGWNETPATMPAEDIVIQGRYIVDTAIEEIYFDLGNIEVYNLKGLRITETDKLTRGIYIININKTYVK